MGRDRRTQRRLRENGPTRIAAESPVSTVHNAAERARRQVGRPSEAEAVLVHALTEDPALRSVELLHRVRLAQTLGHRQVTWNRRGERMHLHHDGRRTSARHETCEVLTTSNNEFDGPTMTAADRDHRTPG